MGSSPDDVGGRVLWWWVDPDLGWQGMWLRPVALEADRMGKERVIEGRLRGGVDRLSGAIVDAVRGHVADAREWRCLVLYQAKNSWQKARASARQPKRAGESGRYFIVLNCASLNGLSSET